MIPKDWLQRMDGSPFRMRDDEWEVSLPSLYGPYTDIELTELRRWLQELQVALRALNGMIP